jgi:hypothetical protein
LFHKPSRQIEQAVYCVQEEGVVGKGDAGLEREELPFFEIAAAYDPKKAA